MNQPTFRNRFTLIIALIGMAVGTGNIWRFPRVMAANGGGAFLIPWFLFLFLWSIPLLSIEFSIGQKLRKGVLGCFSELTGGKYTWLGGFVVLCTLGIMFYYSVVTGWCLYYLVSAISGKLLSSEPAFFWQQFREISNHSEVYHGVSIVLAMGVVLLGVRKGIEQMSLVMIPALFLILVGLAIYSFSLSGHSQAMAFMFNTDFSKLAHSSIWLEALTQSAWSTGAGWGIALTYACYAEGQENPVLVPMTTALGNNSVDILAALMIFPTLFSFFPLPQVLSLLASGNSGLTFISLPGLFQKINAATLLAVLFFLSLFFAAFTSLVSMLELGVCFLKDLRVSRNQAIFMIGLIAFLLGLPSASSQKIFDNQDWVWGVGLLVSGFFFSLLIHLMGTKQFFASFVEMPEGWRRTLFSGVILWLIPFEFLALLSWWFYQSIQWNPNQWWHPFKALTIGTCLFQWGVLLLILFALNGYFNRRLKGNSV